MEYVVSLSYGKDSIYMLELIHRYNLPLDKIVHVEVMATPEISAELPEMLEFKTKARKIIEDRYGIKVEHLKADKSYDEYFYSVRGIRAKKENQGKIYGFPMTRGAWCNSRLKMSVLSEFKKEKYHQYVGYAIDEKNKDRQAKIKAYQLGKHTVNYTLPLIDYNVTEKECYDWCEQNELLSPVYKFTSRGGCWFCHNQRLGELYQLYKNHPEYWKMLLEWDKDSPVVFKTDGTTVSDLDKRFTMGCIYKKEYAQFLEINKQLTIFDYENKEGEIK